jgi:hypothetical protein
MEKQLKDQTVAPQLHQYEEYVPLSVAATVTYFHITETSRQLGNEQHLSEVMHLVAIALSTVAPFYMSSLGGKAAFVLAPREVDDLLFRPLREKGQIPSLENLRIRRQDLHKAMATLKEARIAFGKAK